MKTITNITVISCHDFYWPNNDTEVAICACHSLLTFKKEERQPFETVKIICPKCGCEIVYG